jgi:signal transduction histidine kinase
MNIFTNAQKFTRNANHRQIDFSLGASIIRPETGPDGAKYIPFRNEGVLKSDEQRADRNVRENTEKTIFLTFSIADTGKGLSDKELKQLFKKFNQASPKTYGQYGGSGLGLFITRDLVELQGGQIGVRSKEGHGTTFFFYIKVERIIAGKEISSSLARRLR